MATVRQPRFPAHDDAVRVFRSPGLELVVERIRSAERPVVLDLGVPSQANLDALAALGSRVWIEDLPGSLVGRAPPPPAEGEKPDWESLVDASLAIDARAQVDAVLAWDVFSYLEREAIGSLVETISRACKPGALLFMTVVTEGDLPDEPARMRIAEDGRLAYAPVGPATRSNPAYTPLALERMMPGFRLQHSFLLGEGMQDYLFSFEGG